MTVGLDTLLSSSRMQNAGRIPQNSHVERNHYGGTGHDYYGFSHSNTRNKASSGKKSIALTALTLLAFMFFLNILQNCLQDQTSMNQPSQVMVVSSRLKQPKEADKRKDEVAQVPELVLEIEDADAEEDKTYMKIAKRILKPKKQE